MNFYRETVKNVPSVITVPKEPRNRLVEVIILPLDETMENDANQPEVDKNGYPIGFFERTAGSLPDFLEREPPPVQAAREEIE